MSAESILTIVGIVLGSTGLFTFVQYLINRKDKKHDAIKELKDELTNLTDCLRDERDNQYCDLKSEITELKSDLMECKLDTTRLQMLFIMEHNPDDTRKLMQVAEKYFAELDGDWYMSSYFVTYCKDHDIELPDWFKGEN